MTQEQVQELGSVWRPKTAWICLGATDDMHPWCPFETQDRNEAREHAKHDGHYCVDADRPGVLA